MFVFISDFNYKIKKNGLKDKIFLEKFGGMKNSY